MQHFDYTLAIIIKGYFLVIAIGSKSLALQALEGQIRSCSTLENTGRELLPDWIKK